MKPETLSLTLVDDARDSVGGAPTRTSIAVEKRRHTHGFTVFLSEGPVFFFLARELIVRVILSFLSSFFGKTGCKLPWKGIKIKLSHFDAVFENVC